MQDRDLKQLLASVSSLVAGAVIIQTAIGVERSVGVLGSWSRLGAFYLAFFIGASLIAMAVSGFDYKKWSRKAGVAGFIAVLAITSAGYFHDNPQTGLNSDVTFFTYKSADLITQGRNPYSVSMNVESGNYSYTPRYITPRIDGTTVDEFSYPALSALSFVPQALFENENTAITTGLFLLAIIIFLVMQSAEYLSPLPIGFIYINNLMSLDLIYNINSLWLLPYLVSMKFWAEEKYAYGAAALGLSFAMKQSGWLVAPFLAVWLYREAGDWNELKNKMQTVIGYGGAAFLLPNLPFILWNPEQWLTGVFDLVYSGLAAPQESLGLGISAVKTEGLLYLPKSYFSAVLLAAIAVSLVLYYLYWKEMKWTAWLAPSVLLFFHHRSLSYYFTFFVPVAYYAAILRLKATSGKTMKEQLRGLIR